MKLILQKRMHTINVYVARSRFKICQTKVLQHENFQIYSMQASFTKL